MPGLRRLEERTMRTQNEITVALLKLQREMRDPDHGTTHLYLCQHVEEALRWCLGEDNAVSVLAGMVQRRRPRHGPDFDAERN
jgi:hypothetical protein